MRKPLLPTAGVCTCRSVWVPTLPAPQLPRGRGEGRLPSWSPALSLDPPVGTAPESRGLRRGRPLLLHPWGHTPVTRTLPTTHTPAPGPTRRRSHAQTPALRAPRAAPPGPLPGSRTPARCRSSRWRLLALGSRPPDAARQQPAVAPSLPAAAARPGRLARRLRRGRERNRRGARRSCARGEAAPQAPGEEAAGERAGRDSLTAPVPPARPTPTPALSSPPRHHSPPPRAGQQRQESPRDRRERPRGSQKGAPSTPESGLGGGLCRGVPPQPCARLSRPERCPLLPESGSVHHLRPTLTLPHFFLSSHYPLLSRFLVASLIFLLAGLLCFSLSPPLASWNSPLLPSSLRQLRRGIYFMPRLWLLSTGASLGARVSSSENGRLAGTRLFSLGPGLGHFLICGSVVCLSAALPLSGERGTPPYWMH